MQKFNITCIQDLVDMFNGIGEVIPPTKTFEPVVSLRVNAITASHILQVVDIPFEFDETLGVRYVGVNALDFLHAVVPNDTRLSEWIRFMMRGYVPLVDISKTRVDAVVPSKTRVTDAGYDLTIIEKVKDLNDTTSLYDTGIKLDMMLGTYAEVVPRSSLSKSGYMLANSVGIIDTSYTGNIMIALAKIDRKSPDLTLPFRCCQLIFREQVHVQLRQVDTIETQTSRGSGGFGSTGGVQ